MSEDQPRSLRLPQPLVVVAAAAAGLALCAVVLLLLSARSAGAATLPELASPVPAVSTALGDAASSTPTVAGALGSPDPVSTAVAPLTTDVGQVLGAAAPLSATATPSSLAGLAPSLPISALPVAPPPAPRVLGDVVNQGPQTTATPPSGSPSATTPGVVLRTTGSAGLFPPATPRLSHPEGGNLAPLNPVPVPRHPTMPELPPSAVGVSSALGVHSGLDALPPAALVLALLVVGGVLFEFRRRPRLRFDLRFSPPG